MPDQKDLHQCDVPAEISKAKDRQLDLERAGLRFRFNWFCRVRAFVLTEQLPARPSVPGYVTGGQRVLTLLHLAVDVAFYRDDVRIGDGHDNALVIDSATVVIEDDVSNFRRLEPSAHVFEILSAIDAAGCCGSGRLAQEILRQVLAICIYKKGDRSDCTPIIAVLRTVEVFHRVQIPGKLGIVSAAVIRRCEIIQVLRAELFVVSYVVMRDREHFVLLDQLSSPPSGSGSGSGAGAGSGAGCV